MCRFRVSQVTAHNVLPDARLARLLAADFNGEADEFVAEFELAFVLFLLLPSLPALEHWKAVLHLVSFFPPACTFARSLAPHWARLHHAPSEHPRG